MAGITDIPFQDASVAVDATFCRRCQRGCSLKASLTLRLPLRTTSINVAQLKTLAEIVSQPEQDRYLLHNQIGSRESTTDGRLEYLPEYDLIREPNPKEHYHDRYEFVASDTGIYLKRCWQRERCITPLIDAFQTAIDMTQGTRESRINVAQLYVLKQIVSGRASTLSRPGIRTAFIGNEDTAD